MDLLIYNGTVVTMNQARDVLAGTDVLLRDGRIAHVGKQSSRGQSPQRIVDASGKLVLPGLIHGHLHACQTLFRNQADGLPLLEWLRQRIWPFEAVHDEVSLRSSADLTFAELIKGGATAALDMGTVHHTDAIFESARDCGFRLTGGKAMMDLPDELPPGLRETTSESVSESIRLAKRWHNTQNGRLRYAFAPRFALSCSQELLAEVTGAARELDVGIHTHASESKAEVEKVRERTGKENVEYLHGIGLTGPRSTFAHCVWLSSQERQILSETQTSVCHCPSSNLKLASGLADVPKLLSVGVGVCLGADGAPCNNNLDIFTEMRLATLLHKPSAGADAMPPMQILEMATLGGARALGLSDQLGSIEKGKKADLTLVNLAALHSNPSSGDPIAQLVYSARSSDVTDVVIDGRLVMSNQKLLTLDEERVLSVAIAQARKLATRAGKGR